MTLFKRLKLLFTYDPELDQLLEQMRTEAIKAHQAETRYNLNLCKRHKQEVNQSEYSEQNCDHCKLQRKYKILREALDGVKRV